MADEDFDFEIDIRTTPRPFRVGNDRYELIPEIISSAYLTAFNKSTKSQEQITKEYKEKYEAETGKDLFADKDQYNAAVLQKVNRDPEYLAAVREVTKSLIVSFLEDPSKEPFMEKVYPDRVYTTLVNKLVTIYTGRPTESASGSEEQ